MGWVKNLGAEIERLRPELTEQVMTVELDEMWHFIQKNTKMLGLVGLGARTQTLLRGAVRSRNIRAAQQLWQQLHLFETSLVCTD